MAARNEITNEYARDYGKAGNPEMDGMLDELVDAMTLGPGPARAATPPAQGRPSANSANRNGATTHDALIRVTGGAAADRAAVREVPRCGHE